MVIITARLPYDGAKYRLLLDDIFHEIGHRKAEAPAVCVCLGGTQGGFESESILDHQYHPRQWILQPEPDDGKGLRCLMIINMGSKLTLHMPEPDDGEGLPCQIIDAGRKLTLHILDLLGFTDESTVVLHIGIEKKVVSTKLGDEAWEVINNGALHSAVFHFIGNVYIAMVECLMVVDAEQTHPRMLLVAPWPHKE
ncbi:hypothetical protein GUJ93_ZPchr0006g41349 [Zizania palustris]|uniref:Uncharacterized protein n=1 Tax=Zizania palustris TaxID=103762 RepID=A0A8J5VQ51_ZIZPA|nr:hypothetical protein GUJ93_ZPchr0006g41349 [Zizania palustris]